MIKAENRRILITVSPQTESYLDYVRDYLRELGADPSYSDIVRFLAYRYYRDHENTK